jgi:hypothetical protein
MHVSGHSCFGFKARRHCYAYAATLGLWRILIFIIVTDMTIETKCMSDSVVIDVVVAVLLVDFVFVTTSDDRRDR